MTSSENSKSFARHIPSMLSISRGVIGLTLPFFFLSYSPALHIAGVVLFTVGAITDYFDGWVARKYNFISDLGKFLDPTMDKLIILTPLAIFAYLGFYSMWWVVPIFVREIVITFCRIGWLMEGKAIAAEKLGKIKFCFQVFAISFSLLYLVSLDFVALEPLRVVLYVGVHGFLWLAVLLTLVSGVTFLRSNWSLFRSESFYKFASAVGVGLWPVAPGTWGSALAVLLVALTAWNIYLYLACFFFLLWMGYWAVSRMDLTQNKDPGLVVIDEVCGIFVTFFLIPLDWSALLAGFFLFRIFDILKPFPVRRLEKLPGYWGILFDDLGAGLYSWLVLVYFYGIR